MFGYLNSLKISPVILATLGGIGLSACQTSGGNGILSGVLPDKKGTAENAQPQSAVIPGQNPNAKTRQANTKSALSEYCPAVRIRAGTETYRTFPKGVEKSDLANLNYQATITKVARECDYVGQNLEIKVGARGRVITGPKGSSGSVEMPIRVAVQEGSCSRYFKLHRHGVTVRAGTSAANFQFVDDKIVIPAPKALNIRVYIGFDEGPYDEKSAQPCVS